MSINLIESEQRTQKSLGGTLVSIAVHACLISLAVYATASAVEPHRDRCRRESILRRCRRRRSRTRRRGAHIPSAARNRRTRPARAQGPDHDPHCHPDNAAADRSLASGDRATRRCSAPRRARIAASRARGGWAIRVTTAQPLFAAQVEKPATAAQRKPRAEISVAARELTRRRHRARAVRRRHARRRRHEHVQGARVVATISSRSRRSRRCRSGVSTGGGGREAE